MCVIDIYNLTPPILIILLILHFVQWGQPPISTPGPSKVQFWETKLANSLLKHHTHSTHKTPPIIICFFLILIV